MRKVGKYSPNYVYKMIEADERFVLDDGFDGILIDNMLYVDSSMGEYIMFLETYLDGWSSCYTVYIGGDEMLEIWEEKRKEHDELMKKVEEEYVNQQKGQGK